MDLDEPFNGEYYQYVLQSLTLNSRAIITELSTIAERFPEHADEIVDIIAERIKKCLPQHKLFAMYLLDSICKNIGNPYNLYFGAKLYKIFTECYLVVTDTPTRQDLINLFKTWQGAKTGAGADLFPVPLIQKIEKFIIKATCIGQSQTQTQAQVHAQVVPTSGSGSGSGSGSASSSGAAGQIQANAPVQYQKPDHLASLHKIALPDGSHGLPQLYGPIPSPDSLLRESNLLLQLVNSLNDTYDRIVRGYEEKGRVARKAKINELELMEQERNKLVLKLNAISEVIHIGNKQFYDSVALQYQHELKQSREKLNSQMKVQDKIENELSNENEEEEEEEEVVEEEEEENDVKNKNLNRKQPNVSMFSNWTVEITDDKQMVDFIKGWGVTPVEVSKTPTKTFTDMKAKEFSNDGTSSLLGLSSKEIHAMEQLVLNLNLGSEASATEIDTDQDEELYDPILSFDSDTENNESNFAPTSFLFDDGPKTKKSPYPLVSNLKKRHNDDDGIRFKKKVRFLDDIEEYYRE